MNLLEVGLPLLTLTPDVGPGEFFDRCEAIALSRGYRIDRRRAYAGPGYDQLNLHLGSGSNGYPMLRMVATPHGKRQLSADVVAQWKSGPIDYDEYLNEAKKDYAQLFRDYVVAHAHRLRLGIPRRPAGLDYSKLDCGRIDYAQSKFREAVRSLATGPGDARARMHSVFMIIHPVRPSDLPDLLRKHLEWVYDKITRRPGRHRFEGSVEASLAQMKNSTASKIAERVLALADALDELHHHCQGMGRGSA